LIVGSTVGHYKIVSKLDEGAVGEGNFAKAEPEYSWRLGPRVAERRRDVD